MTRMISLFFVSDFQRNEKCPGQEARCRSNTHDKGSEKEPEKITQNQPVSV